MITLVTIYASPLVPEYDYDWIGLKAQFTSKKPDPFTNYASITREGSLRVGLGNQPKKSATRILQEDVKLQLAFGSSEESAFRSSGALQGSLSCRTNSHP